MAKILQTNKIMHKKSKKNQAFSLIEVLFAVMVLTMGLIFVASQFPIGLALSRQVADDTLSAINAHNAEITFELTFSGNASSVLVTTDTLVHSVFMPNVYSSSVTASTKKLVFDHPGIEYDGNMNTAENWPSWSSDAADDPSTDPDEATTTEDDDWEFLDLLGHIASPPVLESDPAVQKLVRAAEELPGSADYVKEMHKAIFDVTLDRKYTTAALYQHINGNTYRFYIFTLRNTEENNTYAWQDESPPPPPGSPIPEGSSADRRFPVPWWLDLTEASAEILIASLSPPYDRFQFTGTEGTNRVFLRLLRKGSIIIDSATGFQYEVADFERGDTDSEGDTWVRLRQPLRADLQFFWVFPPAIIRDGGSYEFADQQPVVKVAQRIISF